MRRYLVNTYPHPPYIYRFFNVNLLHKVAKRELYAASYGNETLLRDRVDEEGCGAVFAQLKGF